MSPRERLEAATTQLEEAERILAALWADRHRIFDAARQLRAATRNVERARHALAGNGGHHE